MKEGQALRLVTVDLHGTVHSDTLKLDLRCPRRLLIALLNLNEMLLLLQQCDAPDNHVTLMPVDVDTGRQCSSQTAQTAGSSSSASYAVDSFNASIQF